MKRIIVIIILLLFSAYFCAKKIPEMKNGKGKHGKKKNGYSIITVKKTNIVQILEENGEIAPIADADISSRISGRVIKILVDEGDFVSKGKKIAEVEPDASQARTIKSLVNRLNNAKMDLENAEENYLEQKKLFENGFISEKILQDTEDTYIKAERDFDAVKVEYESSKSELGMNEVKVQNLPIISPLTGIILNKYVEEGELITGETSYRSGTQLFTVADLSRLVVKTEINEVDIYKLALGVKVKIKIAANPANDYTGRIFKISPYAETKSGVKVFETEVKINQIDKNLRPGMSATININTRAKVNILAVPVTALFIDEKQEYVFVPDKEKGTKKVYVRRGLSDEFNVEIVSGLKKGMKVFSDIPSKELINMKFIPKGKK